MAEAKKEIFEFKYVEEKDEEIDINIGEAKVIKDKNICLTCSGTRRIVWIEMDGNKKILKKACLMCLVRCPTAANRADP
jgi:hypothetical protein